MTLKKIWKNSTRIEPSTAHIRGNSRTRKHRLSEVEQEEAEREIKDFVDQDEENENNHE